MGVETLTLISTGLKVAGGFQQMQQSNAMAKAARRNAEASIQNEQNTLKIRQQQLAREQEQSMGRARVSAAATGASLSSFDTLMEDMTNQTLLDQALLEYDSKLQQESIRYGGAVQSTELRSQGRSALLSGISAGAGTYMQGRGYAKNSSDRNRAFEINRNNNL